MPAAAAVPAVPVAVPAKRQPPRPATPYDFGGVAPQPLPQFKREVKKTIVKKVPVAVVKALPPKQVSTW